MSRDQWLRHYEELEAEFPEMDDCERSELADERARDERADLADYAHDLAQDRGATK